MKKRNTFSIARAPGKLHKRSSFQQLFFVHFAILIFAFQNAIL